MNSLYPSVAARAAHRCEYCRAPEQVFNFVFEVEHIAPKSGGVDNSFENLALACDSCNIYKSNTTVAWDEIEERETRLYNPRQDQWEEHFVFNDETAEIHGRTAIGRVTVQRLRFNSSHQVRARRLWMRLGLYP